MHVPLKALHSSRSMRRRVTSPHISDNEPVEFVSHEDAATADSEKGNNEQSIIVIKYVDMCFNTGQTNIATAVEDEETGTLSSESENPISDPAAGLESPIFGSPDKRVQFTIGVIPNIPEDESATEMDVHKEPERKDKLRRKRLVDTLHINTKIRKHGFKRRSKSEK